MNGHTVVDDNGVTRLLGTGMQARISELETALVTWRAEQGRKPVPDVALAELPGGRSVSRDHEWRLRRSDLRVVRSVLAERFPVESRSAPVPAVLDVGAWNGWLSASLSEDGYAVVGCDLFAGPNALGARPKSQGDWMAVQLDPLHLDPLELRFDVVIFNRCLQYFPNPVTALGVAQSVLTRGGVIVATGLTITQRPVETRHRLEDERTRFRQRFRMDLLVRPAKGYLDVDDIDRLEEAGLVIQPYPRMQLSRLRARFDHSRPDHRYGVLDTSLAA
jgi:SAM-dependent methyltransferase